LNSWGFVENEELLYVKDVNFSLLMLELIQDIQRKISEYRKIDVSHLAVVPRSTKKRSRGGLIAYVTPLKFPGGSPVLRKNHKNRVVDWAILPIYREGKELKYLIHFLCPRFLNLSFEEKMHTIMHELYHINPDFNGDLRWFKGKSKYHGDLKAFEAMASGFAKAYLADPTHESYTRFLKYNSRQWYSAFGELEGTGYKAPRLKLLKSEVRSIN